MSESATYLDLPVEAWTKLLTALDPLMRRLASYALGQIGPAAGPALPALTAALHDPLSYVRVWAAAGLARVAPEHPDALPVLIAALKDEHSFVRSLAAWHLGRLAQQHPDIEAAMPGLQEVLDDTDRNVRAEAMVALRRLCGKASPPRELKGMLRVPPGLIR